MFGLAAGAVWMVPTMFAGRPLPWLVLPVGWLLGQIVRRWVRTEGVQGAMLAAIATLLAATYTKCLIVAANIAGLMGIGFVDALRESGIDMLMSLARMSLGWAELGIYILGAAVAAFAAWRKPGTAARNRAP
jgi:vitamin B12 transport system permease protein